MPKPTGPWIVEVDMPGGYLLILPSGKMEATSDGFHCTRFSTPELAQKAVDKYYKGRQPLRQPSIFQPEWLKKERGDATIQW